MSAVIRALVVLAVALMLVPTAAAVDRVSVPDDLKVLSYYPADAGWTEMWTESHPAEVARDLDRALALHTNTVRAIVQRTHSAGRPCRPFTRIACSSSCRSPASAACARVDLVASGVTAPV